MRMEEFKKYLESLESIETQIVYIKYKHSWEENWTYSNEILEVDMNADGYYAWASDWNEGQEDIEILGCIALCDIYVPKFQKDTEVKRKSKDIIYRQDAVDVINELHDKPNAWLDLAVEALEKLPSAEPERKKGKWIDTGSGQECSKCHEIQYGYDSFRYFCAFCGADMRGEQE